MSKREPDGAYAGALNMIAQLRAELESMRSDLHTQLNQLDVLLESARRERDELRRVLRWTYKDFESFDWDDLRATDAEHCETIERLLAQVPA